MRREPTLFSCDLALARRLEAMETFCSVDTSRTVAKLHPEIPAAAESIAGGWAVFTGIGSPISEARGLGLHRPVTDTDMDRLEAFYHSRGDSIRIEVCPLAHPSLHQLLAARGYRLMEFSNMLARPLAAKDITRIDLPNPQAQGRESRTRSAAVSTRLAKPSESPFWADTVAHCFAGQVEITQELINVVSCWAHSTIGACYFGLVGGEVAGGATIAIHARVGLLGGAGTMVRFRNRGLQQALIAARLKHAARAGCTLAMTVTLPGSGSQRNCERFGFRVAYTRAKFVHD
jgi:GNAT superfamily N-acetyltransferase